MGKVEPTINGETKEGTYVYNPDIKYEVKDSTVTFTIKIPQEQLCDKLPIE